MLYYYTTLKWTTGSELRRIDWRARATVRQWLILLKEILTANSHAPVKE